MPTPAPSTSIGLSCVGPSQQPPCPQGGRSRRALHHCRGSCGRGYGCGCGCGCGGGCGGGCGDGGASRPRREKSRERTPRISWDLSDLTSDKLASRDPGDGDSTYHHPLRPHPPSSTASSAASSAASSVGSVSSYSRRSSASSLGSLGSGSRSEDDDYFYSDDDDEDDDDDEEEGGDEDEVLGPEVLCCISGGRAPEATVADLHRALHEQFGVPAGHQRLVQMIGVRPRLLLPLGWADVFDEDQVDAAEKARGGLIAPVIAAAIATASGEVGDPNMEASSILGEVGAPNMEASSPALALASMIPLAALSLPPPGAPNMEGSVDEIELLLEAAPSNDTPSMLLERREAARHMLAISFNELDRDECNLEVR